MGLDRGWSVLMIFTVKLHEDGPPAGSAGIFRFIRDQQEEKSVCERTGYQSFQSQSYKRGEPGNVVGRKQGGGKEARF